MSVGKWCYVFFIVARIIETECIFSSKSALLGPAPEFSRHAVIKPQIFHAREKREIMSTKKDGGGHIHDVVIGYNVNGKDYVLDLHLNRNLVPEAYFERYQNNGQHIVNKPTGEDVELCQYQGEIRDIHNSWAAVSTCDGLSGVIFDGEEMHYLEKAPTAKDKTEDEDEKENGITDFHFVYSHSDLKTNHTCGYSGVPHHTSHNHEFNRILRYKRSTDVIRGPYNADKRSRYLELVMVADNKEYREMGSNRRKVYRHFKNIANIINVLYMPLNIYITLVGVVVWTDRDEIDVSPNGDTTLNNFLSYRKQLVRDHPNDNAQLLTRMQFQGGVVGKALKGPICTYDYSGGVNNDHSSVVGLVAATVAHEMGHNFGMEHDTEDCECPNDRCIMAPSTSSVSPTQWSSCSLNYLALAYQYGMDYCMRNKPKRLFDSPLCGNGFVEAGEQCDCGMKGHCDNPCCNASTCMLYANASCATGECCDLKTCQLKTAGSMCRPADYECDLPEYCTGQSEYCPDDVFKMNGEMCEEGKAFCYDGQCRTHGDQCRLLWGPSGKNSHLQCYKMNIEGTRHGHCGYNRLKDTYAKCKNEHMYCGMLQCKHLNEKLEFGIESAATVSQTTFKSKSGGVILCKTAIVDLGLEQIDPGLVPNGAKCGEGKMCVNQKCISVDSLRQQTGIALCPQDCSGNGVCNSRGHCHCNKGYAPPFCDYPGTGGSEDSGPASDPNARRKFVMALYIIFLGIVPLIALIAIFIYFKHSNASCWWKKSSTNTKTTTQKPSYVTSNFCSSVSGCFGRISGCLSTGRSSASNVHAGGGNTHLPRDTPPSKHASPATPRVKPAITKTALVSTTNTDVIITVESRPTHQVGPAKQNNRTVGGFSREDRNIKVIMSSDDNLSDSSLSDGMPISRKKEMFMKSNLNKSVISSHTQVTSKNKSNIGPVRSKTKSSTNTPDTKSQKPGVRNPSTSSTSSLSKGDQSKRVRKNSKSFQLKLKLDPIKQKLIEMSDSCPSTPETPPTIKFKNNPMDSAAPRPSVAQLSSQFEKGNVSNA